MKRSEPHITRLMQLGLMKEGYELPEYGADGRWGQETQRAYDDYVAKQGATVPAINAPSATSNCIVDLSHHNNNIDFAAAKNDGIVAVIHKATQSTGYVDPTYGNRKARARDAGLLWGAYHFGVGHNGDEQADHFLNIVKPEAGDLLVLDFEGNPLGHDMSLDEAEEFVQCVYEATGRWPGLYSGHTIKQLLGSQTNTVLANCWFWLAQYGKHPKVPPAWPTWTMWQYTNGAVGPEPHTVQGIGHCDRDKFNGALDDLETFWNQQ